MIDFYTLASSRRSIRKYTDDNVPVSEIIECLKTAVTAPSGCNSQCWKFVVIRNKAVLQEAAAILCKKQKEVLDSLGMKYDDVYLEARNKMLTFFTKAPVCVAVFMRKLDYYDKRLEEAFLDKGYSYKELMETYSNPDILSIGAAVQNFLLAVHEKGLGACWMNDPVIARSELAELFGAKDGEVLMSLIPVGVGAYTPRSKKYKEFAEVVKIME
ncbi:MAG TPA: nitroreductase family protein [Treponemataceae bacterium]|jgi:nitroreductase|nr:nitroreductase family protein [Treponemataceae bacterium]